MRRQVRVVATGLALALLGVAVALMPGCTRSYPFVVRGVVRSAADGSPLAGVALEIDASTHGRVGLPATTAADGSFDVLLQASEGSFGPGRLPRWTATLSKDGYATEVVDVSPRGRPESHSATSQVVLVVYLRPKGP